MIKTLTHKNISIVCPKNRDVKEYAEERGWEYEEVGFLSALWASTKALNNAWKTPAIVIDTTIEANANFVEDFSE